MDIFERHKHFTAAREAKKAGIYPYFIPIESGQKQTVKIGRKKFIMIGSNDYLGLALHPKLKEAAIKAIKKYGVGCTGSRFLNGTMDIHVQLERKLAEFTGRESAQLFTTGAQANMGAIQSLAGKDDIIYSDRLNHASIVDGCRMSFAETKRYRHNATEDLERQLIASDPDKGKFIVVDGIFSMEGDIVKLPEIVKLARKYGARIMVDDAHSIGVLGNTGRGTGQHFGLEKEIDVQMGTCSKSFASVGGFICGSEEMIDYVKHNARALMFTAALPPASAASISAAIDIVRNEGWRREALWENARFMREGFKSIGYDTGVSETPIVPVMVGNLETALLMRKLLFEARVFTTPVLPPAVSPAHCMIRTSYMATHTKKQLTYVLEVFNKIGKQIGLVQGAPASFYPKKERKLKLKILRGKRRRIFKERLRKTTRRIRQRIRIRKHK
jgi:8-amino-7-oxononanoate synthase